MLSFCWTTRVNPQLPPPTHSPLPDLIPVRLVGPNSDPFTITRGTMKKEGYAVLLCTTLLLLTVSMSKKHKNEAVSQKRQSLHMIKTEERDVLSSSHHYCREKHPKDGAW